jgi:tRNA modification GTPase
LTRAITSLRGGDDPELTSLDLREALTAVGEIAGIVDTEEILGEIFSNFCIGK